MELLNWQKRWLTNHSKRIIWAETGLGKGVLGSYLANMVYSKNKNVLIVTPSHLQNDWYNKIKDFNNDININITKRELTSGINIMTYNSIVKNTLFQHNNKIDLLIIDESHRTKNYKGQTFKKLLKIVQNNNPFTLCLSGTPFTKSSLDLLPQIYLTQPNIRIDYPNYYNMLLKIAELQVKHFGSKSINVFTKIKDSYFKDFLNEYVFKVDYDSEEIRRPEYIIKKINTKLNKKASDKINEFLSIENFLDNPSFEMDKILRKINNPHSTYLQAVNGFIYDVNDTSKFTECGLNDKIKLLEDIIDNDDNKILCLHFFNAENDMISKINNVYTYKKYSKKTIEEQIYEFENSDKHKMFSANIASIGEGIRFKNTKRVIIFTEQYDYGRILQAMGRIQYVGNSLDKTLICYIFESDFEFSKKIRKNLSEKMNLVNNSKNILDEGCL